MKYIYIPFINTLVNSAAECRFLINIMPVIQGFIIKIKAEKGAVAFRCRKRFLRSDGVY